MFSAESIVEFWINRFPNAVDSHKFVGLSDEKGRGKKTQVRKHFIDRVTIATLSLMKCTKRGRLENWGQTIGC